MTDSTGAIVVCRQADDWKSLLLGPFRNRVFSKLEKLATARLLPVIRWTHDGVGR